jgi:acetoacetyl-CoA synthetase
VWDFCDVRGERGERSVLAAEHFWKWRFFQDARLNVAANLLRRSGSDAAMVFRGEDGEAVELSWDELHALVSRLQQALTADGVQPGDRVGAWLPNRPETYALMIAAASLGAVFSSCSPDFGADGVLDRFGQIEPALLVGAEGYHYGGKHHDCRQRLAEVSAALPSARRVVTLGSSWDDWLAPYSARPVTFTPLPFDHPWYVLYSSGTTGKPKCIVHRAGGVLLKHLVEHQLHADVRAGDRVFYFTTAGWMMWNWLASGLASDATLVLYDGSPFHPGPQRLFDLVDEVGVNLLGVSAKFIDAAAKAGLRPAETHELTSLRTITSTGSPLVAEGFEFVYRHVKRDVHLASISGGTDLCGCLVAGDPTSPVWAGEIQRPGLGMDIAVVDDAGGDVGVGEPGELVCRRPFPSMPLGFFGDDADDTRYRAAYFDRIPGVWHHGDFCSVTEHGGYVITGRSDATLNPGGVRIGTAEIYRRVDAHPAVLESLVIGQEWDGDTRIVLFVRLAEGVLLTDELRADLRADLRQHLSPRHVPAVIVAVPDLPRTRSGKLTELAVRDVVHGRPVKNTEALANPDALAYFAHLPELI